MAARLTVIISQAAARSSAATDLEESLVAELLFQAGLDANLVSPLEHIEPESTDHLCISGFNHNLALISWLDAAQVQTHFDRLGLDGTVRSLNGSAPAELSEAGSASRRSIFLLQLQTGSRIPQVLEQLKRLLEARRTPTFSILPATPLPAKPQRKPTNAGPAAQPANSSPAVANPPEATTPHASKQAPPSESLPRDDAELSEEQWSQLDQLVDDFDALDF